MTGPEDEQVFLTGEEATAHILNNADRLGLGGDPTKVLLAALGLEMLDGWLRSEGIDPATMKPLGEE